jgi:hypothetical protein
VRRRGRAALGGDAVFGGDSVFGSGGSNEPVADPAGIARARAGARDLSDRGFDLIRGNAAPVTVT